MGFREDLARKIDKKRAEIEVLEEQVKTSRTYLQALEDMYKLAGRESSAAVTSSAGPERVQASASFRAGSMTGAAYDALKKAGRPLHVNTLLPAIGRGITRADKSAISGTLAAYVRKGDVFTRPAPNTFGLVEFGDLGGSDDIPGPPPGFGQL
jgi:hypothetical protein